ncbi:MAG: SpoIIE family protein phosphatase [Tissierellia bacterium]|nr:SpoIIE family protein phosphatase [Tissierellia bacterium]
MQREYDYAILNSMDDWVRLLDKDGNVIFINDAIKNNCENPEINRYMSEKSPYVAAINHEFVKKSTIVEEKFIAGKYYNVKISPLFHENEHIGAIEVYRDITNETKMKIDLFNANRKMIDDIRFARKIQKNILPKNLNYDGLRLDSIYLPCDNLSGDMFDIIKIDENRYAFYIADVMGHGVTASIMTMFIKQTTKAILDKNNCIGPSEVLKRLKKKFFNMDNNTSQYFTIWIAIFDLKEDEMIFSNAGHNCIPLLKTKKEIKQLYLKGRMISNVFDDDNFKQVTIKLNKEDQILFYTDGVTESINFEKEFFGIDRLKEIFLESNTTKDILDELKEFSWGEQKDDIALAIIKYKETK